MVGKRDGKIDIYHKNTEDQNYSKDEIEVNRFKVFINRPTKNLFNFY